MKRLIVCGLLLWAGCGKVPTPIEPEIEETTGEKYQTGQTGVSVKDEPFDITLTYTNAEEMPFSIQTALIAAKQRWESVIVEGLPDVNDRIYGLGPIDDILISVSHELRNVTDENDRITLGSARPILARTGSLGLPYYGSLRTFPILANSSYTHRERVEVILHELCHVLGFSETYLDQVGTETIGGIRYFNGIEAAKGYRTLLYYIQQEKLAFAIPDIRVPLMIDNPHWAYPSLMWELMSPTPSQHHKQQYFSAITMGAMEDIGYVINATSNEVPSPELLTKPAVGHTFHCDGQHISLISGGM